VAGSRSKNSGNNEKGSIDDLIAREVHNYTYGFQNSESRGAKATTAAHRAPPGKKTGYEGTSKKKPAQAQKAKAVRKNALKPRARKQPSSSSKKASVGSAQSPRKRAARGAKPIQKKTNVRRRAVPDHEVVYTGSKRKYDILKYVPTGQAQKKLAVRDKPVDEARLLMAKLRAAALPTNTLRENDAVATDQKAGADSDADLENVSRIVPVMSFLPSKQEQQATEPEPADDDVAIDKSASIEDLIEQGIFVDNDNDGEQLADAKDVESDSTSDSHSDSDF
jgi:hypothetical protein